MKQSYKEIKIIISYIRYYVQEERKNQKQLEKIDIFFINVLEISTSLAELGITQDRPIRTEEEYWFEGGYHLDFWDPNLDEKYYKPLVELVKENNYFRD